MRRASDLVVGAIEDLESGKDITRSAHGDATWAIVGTKGVNHNEIVTSVSGCKSATLFSDSADDLILFGHIVEPGTSVGNLSSLRRHVILAPEGIVQVQIDLLFGPLDDLALKVCDAFGMFANLKTI